MSGLTRLLISNSDKDYAEFSKKLTPDTNYKIIGVRVPVIKKIAKIAIKENLAEEFLTESHAFYEEYFLHGIILGLLKSDNYQFFKCLNDFLPKIDNWAICDGTVAGIKRLKKMPSEALEFAKSCLDSNLPYVKRFGVVTLTTYFLDENFSPNILELVSKIKSENYYVNMAIAWFFSVALVKKYDETLQYLTTNKLSKFIHDKTIQKAIESFRISDEKKTYLRTLKNKRRN